MFEMPHHVMSYSTAMVTTHDWLCVDFGRMYGTMSMSGLLWTNRAYVGSVGACLKLKVGV